MIPKIIHQIWLGTDKAKPQMIIDCEESVKRIASQHGYDYILWNESNLPPIPVIKDLLRLKKYALCSDIIRLYALYLHGGIYLDSDIELLLPPDDLLKEKVFVGIYIPYLSANIVGNGVIGAEKKHPFIYKNLLLQTASVLTKIKPFYGVNTINHTLFKMGLEKYGEQRIGDVLILDKSKFYPESNRETSYTIHHDLHSWRGKGKLANAVNSVIFKVTRVFDIITYYMASPKLFKAMCAIAPKRSEYDKIGHYCRTSKALNEYLSHP